jgi:hypothetical protein
MTKLAAAFARVLNAQKSNPSSSPLSALYVKCEHCGHLFRSTAIFPSIASLQSARESGIVAQCPTCLDVTEFGPEHVQALRPGKTELAATWWKHREPGSAA